MGQTKQTLSAAKERLVISGSLILAVVVGGFGAFQYFHYEVAAAGVSCAVATGLLIGTRWVRRWGMPADTHIGLVLFALITSISYFRGGAVGEVLAWSVALPTAAALLGRSRGALIWLLLVPMQYGVLFVVQRLGLAPARVPASPYGALGGYAAVAAILVVATILMNQMRQRSLQQTKEAQKRLYRSNKLEGIARLAGGVAHDFNNLLAVVASRARIVSAQLDSHHECQQDLQAIEQATRRGSALTRHLLAIGKEEPAGEHLAFDLNEVIADVAKLLGSTLPDNVILEVEVGSTPKVVEADPKRIHQVAMNLALNARDAMPGGGQLLLTTTTKTTPTPTPDGGTQRWVVLRVRDEGEGIHEEVLDEIFEPFFTTKSHGEGSGLGLAVVHGIVTGLGGRVDVESAPKRGTTVTVWLPASAVEPTLLSRDEARISVPAAPETVILLVEDDRAVRTATRRLLKLEGHTIIQAEDGATALALSDAHDGTIQVLLTDVVMPGMSGTELARHMRQRRPEIGVIFTSGHTGGELDETKLDPEDALFLPKPVAPEAFAKAIAELRRGEKHTE